MKNVYRSRYKAQGTSDALDMYKGKSANEIAALVRMTGDSFLKSPEWKKLRAEAVQFFGNTCMKCGTWCESRRLNVDHIKPRKYYPHLSLDLNNLQVLCGRCNQEKGNTDFTNYGESYTDPALADIKHLL
jgi:5-methylcytosine-specific restriction endonuclease McrA